MRPKYQVIEAENDALELDADQFNCVVSEATIACIEKNTLDEIAHQIRDNVRISLGGEYITVGTGGYHIWIKALVDGENDGEKVCSGDRLVMIS